VVCAVTVAVSLQSWRCETAAE